MGSCHRTVCAAACAVATVLGCGSTVLAQDAHLVKTTRAGHAVIILGYARSDQNCEGITPPVLYLDKPAEHGTVCWRPGKLKLREAIVGNLTQCLGRDIRGVNVVYFPRWKYVGSDGLQYTVEFPNARHRVEVSMTVLTDGSSSPDSPFADMGEPVGDDSQSPGPMPECAASVS